MSGAGAGVRNVMRWRAILRGRAYKGLFLENGLVRADGEKVLADLRDFCFATRSGFDKDPAVMARREGRREVFLRIQYLLGLSEDEVRQFMEVDDGI